jgi:hypothetical protein
VDAASIVPALHLIMLDYATAKNLRGETLAECTERFRRDFGLFAEERALHWSSFFDGRHNSDMAIFYKLVYRFISIGVDMDQWRKANERSVKDLGQPQPILPETWIPPQQDRA